MYLKAIIAIIFIHEFLIAVVYGHMIFNRPEVFGISDPIALEQPLDKSSTNWVCAGKTPGSKSKVIHLQAGRTYGFDITCGERNLNSPGCLTGDWHAGDLATDYAGCLLSINYKGYANAADYKIMSHSKQCAKRGSNSHFRISSNVENCDLCICSWSFAPSVMHSTPQFFHNCFYCKITGWRGKQSRMRTMMSINVPGSQYDQVTYNNIFKIT